MKPRKPFFIITIDTEGDNLWSKPREITTQNALYLPRFQELCERFGFKPTWLTNYEMAKSDTYVDFAKDVLERNAGEVGMHLHAWNNPPIKVLTDNDYKYHPYLIEYPDQIMREKIHVITDILETTFSCKMKSHRAGRWSFDLRYASMLLEEGYKVDCSVTPHVSWRNNFGDPVQNGGTDYSQFPEESYIISKDSLKKTSREGLLEVPMTIMILREWLSSFFPRSILMKTPLKRYVERLMPPVWLRPNGRNLHQMLWILELAKARNLEYVEFMLHSSEFMPNGSPNFPNESSIEKLYVDLEELFVIASERFQGVTLSEFAEWKLGQ